MSASLIDANVLLDIATADPVWMAWSQKQLRLAAGRGTIFVNPVIVRLQPSATTSRFTHDLEQQVCPTLVILVVE